MKFLQTHKKDILCIIIYFLLTVIYFHQPLFHPGSVLYPASDMVTEHTWWRHFLIDTIKQTHMIPLWYNYEFSGNIFQANPSTSIFYPINVLFFFITPEYGLTYDLFLDVFLMSLFTFIFVKKISQDRSAAFISGIVAMLGGTAIARIYEGHVANLDSIIWLPLLLYYFEQQLRTRKIRYTLLNGLTVALCILAGAPQLTVYALFSAGLYVLLSIFFSLIYKKNIQVKKQLLLTSIAFLLGFGLTAIQLVPTLEFAKYSIRNPKSYEFASSVAMKPFHTIAFFYPHFFGSLVNGGRIWGSFSFPEFSTYCGVAAYLLVIAAFFKKKNPYVIIFSILLIFSFLYSLGKYGLVFNFFYHLPVFGTFRIPASFLFLFAFSVSVLAGFGFKNLKEFVVNHDKKLLIRLNRIYFEIVALSLLAYVFFLSSSSFIIKAYYQYFNSHYTSKNMFDQHIRDSYVWIVKDTFLFFAYAIIFFILFLLFQKNKITQRFFTICIALLIIIDLFHFDLPYLMAKPYKEVYKTTVSKDLYNLVGNNRVYDIDIGVDTGPNKLDNINGYNPAYFKYYRDFFYRAGDHFTDPNSLQAPFVILKNIKNLMPIRLLNTKYILAEDEKHLDSWAPKNLTGTTYKKFDEYFALEIDNTQPKAYLVPNAEVVLGFDKQLDRINNDDFDPNNTVVLDTSPKVPLKNTPGTYEINNLKVLPNSVSLTTKSTQPAFLVMSYVWYPGWNVRVNGQKEQLLKSNGIFRGVHLEKGVNRVVFSFEPVSFKIGAIISLIFASVYVFILGITLFKNIKKI